MSAASDRLLVGRYQLREPLAETAKSTVVAALDTITGAEVVIKFASDGRIRREAGLLRLVRPLGVADLLDQGRDGDRAFLVTRRVQGAPFPGAVARTWEAIRGPTIALLETLAQLHRLGLAHGDLKPDNVLVTPTGQVTVLDFDTVQQAGKVDGTAAYMPPERLFGQGTTASGDLYAVGVMVYEALTGRLPRAVQGGLLRLDRPVPTLAEAGVSAPAVVWEGLRQCLQVQPGQRPQRAASLLMAWEALREPAALPLLGRDAVLEALCEAAEQGRSMDIAGPPGIGRTRLLHTLAARLGERARLLAPGPLPLAGLAELLAVPVDARARLSQTLAAVQAALVAWLARGGVLLVDDADRLDRWTGRVVAAARGSGAVLCAWRGDRPGASTLAPLGAAALQSLFAGPQRLLHLPEDAAALLLARTAGVPVVVAGEVDRWLRLGLARWEGGRLVVHRADLTAIQTLTAPVRQRRGEAMRAPSAPEADLLAWLALSVDALPLAALASLAEQPGWLVEALLGDLEAAGGVVLEADGWRLGPAVPEDIAAGWSPERRQAARRALGLRLPSGHPRRLGHLIAGDAREQLIAEIRACATLALQSGRTAASSTLLRTGLNAARALDEEPPAALRCDLVVSALCEATRPAIDLALYELSRSTPDATTAALEVIARAWTLTVQGDGRRALALLSDCPPVLREDLHIWWHSLRVWAARRCDLPTEEATVQAAITAMQAIDSADAAAAAQNWLGRLRYRQGAYPEAAAAFRAARERTRLSARLSAMLNEGSALLESGRWTEAADIAAEAAALACRSRQPVYEGRACWIRRAATLRAGRPQAVDVALIQAAAALDVPNLAAMILLNEAAIAWWQGDRSQAGQLAVQSMAQWTAYGWSLLAALAAALAVATGTHTTPAVQAEPGETFPGIRLQIIGLLAAPGDAAARHRAVQLAARIPAAQWSRRREILSIDDVFRRLNPDQEHESEPNRSSD